MLCTRSSCTSEQGAAPGTIGRAGGAPRAAIPIWDDGGQAERCTAHRSRHSSENAVVDDDSAASAIKAYSVSSMAAPGAEVSVERAAGRG